MITTFAMHVATLVHAVALATPVMVTPSFVAMMSVATLAGVILIAATKAHQPSIGIKARAQFFAIGILTANHRAALAPADLIDHRELRQDIIVAHGLRKHLVQHRLRQGRIVAP